jgi:hypothetical protein
VYREVETVDGLNSSILLNVDIYKLCFIIYMKLN